MVSWKLIATVWLFAMGPRCTRQSSGTPSTPEGAWSHRKPPRSGYGALLAGWACVWEAGRGRRTTLSAVGWPLVMPRHDELPGTRFDGGDDLVGDGLVHVGPRLGKNCTVH